MFHSRITVLLSTFALLSATSSQAATIVWGSAQAATSPADIVSGGNVVLAIDGNNRNVPDWTEIQIGDITFTPQNTLGGPQGSTSPRLDNTSGDAAYDALLTWNTVGVGAGTSDIEIAGLTAGTSYYVQVWYIDTRTCCAARSMTLGDGVSANEVSIQGGPVGSLGHF